MIVDGLKNKIAEAMKAKDEVRLSTLRLLLSALHYERIEKQHDLSEEEELAVVKKEAKKRKDAIEVYEKVGAKDRAEKEKQELAILNEYLPEEMSDEELSKMVSQALKETGAKTMADMGKVMGAVMNKSKGAADGKKVAEIVRKKLDK